VASPPKEEQKEVKEVVDVKPQKEELPQLEPEEKEVKPNNNMPTPADKVKKVDEPAPEKENLL